MGSPAVSPPAGRGRLEAALLRSEPGEAQSYREGEPVAITYTEELDDGKTLSISPEVEFVLGFTQAEWMADPVLWVKLMHPDDRDRVVEACNSANRARQMFRADYRMIARDGRVVRIHDEASVVFGPRGHALCWQGTMLVLSSTPDPVLQRSALD